MRSHAVLGLCTTSAGTASGSCQMRVTAFVRVRMMMVVRQIEITPHTRYSFRGFDHESAHTWQLILSLSSPQSQQCSKLKVTDKNICAFFFFHKTKLLDLQKCHKDYLYPYRHIRLTRLTRLTYTVINLEKLGLREKCVH